jgi:PRC-barrel domain protein
MRSRRQVMNVDSDERFARIWQLFGYEVIDGRGIPVGAVTRLWPDNATGSLDFLGLKTGRFARTTHVVPATQAAIDTRGRTVHVAYSAETIRSAPSYDTDIPLTDAQARKVASHYGR